MLLGIAEMLVFMMSGAIPVERLPVIFRWVSLILPLSHSVKSIRYTLSGFYAKAWIESSWEALIGLVYLVLAYFTLRVLEFVARKHGGVDVY